MDPAEHLFQVETATLNATQDPDRSSEYKEATIQDSDDDCEEGESENAQEENDEEAPRKARKFFDEGTAVLLAVGGLGVLGMKLLLDNDDDEDVAAIIEHGTGNAPGPQPTSEMAVAQRPPPSAPPPPPAPAQPSQVLQQMACQAAANAAGAVGAGAAGAAGAAAAAAGIMGVAAA